MNCLSAEASIVTISTDGNAGTEAIGLAASLRLITLYLSNDC